MIDVIVVPNPRDEYSQIEIWKDPNDPPGSCRLLIRYLTRKFKWK